MREMGRLGGWVGGEGGGKEEGKKTEKEKEQERAFRAAWEAMLGNCSHHSLCPAPHENPGNVCNSDFRLRGPPTT